MSNGRWWEFYFVRYFVGTVFGMLLVIFLNTKESIYIKAIPTFSNISSLEFSSVFILASIGLAFCYISSAPILVLHALRGNFKSFKEEKTKCICIAFIVFIPLILGSYFLFNVLFDTKSLTLNILALISFIAIFGAQVYLYLYTFLSKGTHLFEFYKELVKNRSSCFRSNKEYVESYKHLREHGNAFLILVLEIILALSIYVIQKPIYMLIMVFLWIMPASLVWFVGTFLEGKISKI